MEDELKLSQVKVAQLSKQPILETSISKTKDGKWIIHKTTIPMKETYQNYLKKWPKERVERFAVFSSLWGSAF